MKPYAKYPQFLASWLTILFPLLILIGSSAADIGMSMIAVLFLLHSVIHKDWQWTKESWVRCLFLLWLYMNLRGLLVTESLHDAMHRGLPFIRYFLFAAALAYWTLKDETVFLRFQKMLAGAVFFLVADGFVQLLTGKDIFMRNTVYLVQADNTRRLTGPYAHPILGIMLAYISFPVCIALLINPSGKLQLRPISVVVVLVLAAITFSGERTALMLTLLGWGLAAFLMPVRKIYPLIALCVGAVLVLVIMFFDQEIFRRYVLSVTTILTHWQDSPYGKLFNSDVKVAEVNPVFGVGTNQFRLYCPKFYPGMEEKYIPTVCNTHPHNIYFEWFIEQGVIGFALFMIFIALMVKKLIAVWPTLRTNAFFIGALIAFAIRLWPLASTTTFYSPFGAPPFWMMVGILVFYEARARKATLNPLRHAEQGEAS